MTIPSMVYRWFRPHEPNHIPRRRDTSTYSFSTYLYLLTYCASSIRRSDLYADESEAGVTPPVSCFYVSRLPHLPTYFEPRGRPQTETSNPNRPPSACDCQGRALAHLRISKAASVSVSSGLSRGGSDYLSEQPVCPPLHQDLGPASRHGRKFPV